MPASDSGPPPGMIPESQGDFARPGDGIDERQHKHNVVTSPRQWYHKPALAISILALVVSTSFSLYSIIRDAQNQRLEERKRKLESLRQVMEQLADVRADWIVGMSAEAGRGQAAVQLAGVRNVKRHLLLESAEALSADVKAYVSAVIWESLAYELESDGRFAEATAYFENGQKIDPDSNVSRIGAIEELAVIYMTPGNPNANEKLAKKDWALASTLLASHQGEYGLQQRSEMYAKEAWLYAANHRQLEADSLRRLGRATIDSMSPLNTAREPLSLQLTALSKGISEDSQRAVDRFLSETLGDWQVTVGGNPSVGGVVTFLPGSQPHTLSVSGAVLEKGVLVRSYSGTATPSGPRALRIVWSGAGAGAGALGAPWVAIAGMTALSERADHSLVGEDFALGSPKTPLRLTRPEAVRALP